MRKCPECGKKVTGKADKIYCSSKCGNRYRVRKYYKSNPEKMKAKRIAENSKTENRILIRIRSRAKINGVEFDLELSDIVIPEVCPVLGIPITPDSSKYVDGSPSVDRIDPKGGYVKTNIRIISARANLLKSNATVQELTKILKDLKEINGCNCMGR